MVKTTNMKTMSINDIINQCIALDIRLTKQQDNLKLEAPKGVVSETLLGAIKDNKQALLDFLHRYGSKQPTQALTRVYPEEHEAILSSGQGQMWFLDKMFKNNENYQFYRVLHISGSIDTMILDKAFAEIMARHTILRTTYHITKKAVMQRIGDGLSFAVAHLDLTATDKGQQQALIDAAALEFKQSPFDLEQDLMIRALLIKTDADAYELHLKLHHIATDGWSIALIVKEFTDIYNALIGQTEAAQSDAFQYIDYARWQQSEAQQQSIAQHLAFFDEYLQDAPQMHNLPIFADKRTDLAEAALVQTTLDSELTSALKAFCQAHNVTVFSFIQFGLSIVISHYSQCKETIMGTPMANRPLNELGKVVGYFVNTLPLRTKIDTDEAFISALKTQHLNLLDVMEKQNVPFGEIVKRNVTSRQQGVSPLAQVMFSLQNNDIPTLRLGEAEITVQTPKTDSTELDLSIKCSDEHGAITANWIFARDLFEREFIAQMAQHLNRLVAAALLEPQRAIASLMADK